MTAYRDAVDDVITHEALHVHLALADHRTEHQHEPWYAAVRRLSPAALGHALDARRGADRRSVRVPNPDGDKPATVVRKVPCKQGCARH